MRIISSVSLLAISLLIPGTAHAQTAADSVSKPVIRCEYAATGPSVAASEHVPFPDGDLFRPLLAAWREPRSLFSYGRIRFGDGATPDGVNDNVDAGSIAAGGVVGIWRRETGRCRGVQVSLIGGVFADFNLDAYSRDLLNSDFVVGAQIAFRNGWLAARVRAYHQSSHLGGDFVVHHPTVGDSNYGYQTVDGLLSIERDWWRVYGGAGYVDFMNDSATSWLVQAGGELRGPRMWGLARPIAGFDARKLQVYESGAALSGSGGVEWASPGETRRMRVVFMYSTGVIPLGQLTVDQRSRSVRTQFQIEF